jgi:hypothetical protein
VLRAWPLKIGGFRDTLNCSLSDPLGFDAWSDHGAIAQALRSADATFLPNGKTSFKVIADLGTAVGSKGQTGVRVIVDFTGRIVSAFPVHP